MVLPEFSSEAKNGKEQPQPQNIELFNKWDDSILLTTEGGRVRALKLGGVDVIRTDEHNPKRSGIPILGPNPGPVEGAWAHLQGKGKKEMASHGSDRSAVWQPIESARDSVVLRREYTGEDHPLIGMSTLEIGIQKEKKFSLTRSTKNTGPEPVKVGTGLHTYFPADATFLPLSGSDLEKFNFKTSFPLIDGEVTTLPGALGLRMIMERDGHFFLIESAPAPRQMVLWAEDAEDHQCVEPWWAEVGNAEMLAPGEIRTETYTIKKIQEGAALLMLDIANGKR